MTKIAGGTTQTNRMIPSMTRSAAATRDAFRGRHALASLPAGIWAFGLIEIWIKTTRNFPVGNRRYGLLILWRRSSNGENVLAGFAGYVASTADTLTDLTTNKGKVAESNINWELLNTDRSAMFTSVVSASKRHTNIWARGAYRIWAVIISAL